MSKSNKNRIVVLGAGESGTGAAILAMAKGFDVFLSDKGLIKPEYIAELTESKITLKKESIQRI